VKLSKLTFLRTLTLLATISLATVARGDHGEPSDHEGAAFVGALWVVSNSASQAATFPVPAQAPDATFHISSAAFFREAPPASGSADVAAPYGDNTIAGFLGSTVTISGLQFSGLVNPILGAPVAWNTAPTDGTPISPATYGIFVEVKGYAILHTNDNITVLHDSGVSLRIDGVAVPGITSTGGMTSAVSEKFQYTGRTGRHFIDVVFSNFTGQGVLAFSPDLQLGASGD